MHGVCNGERVGVGPESQKGGDCLACLKSAELAPTSGRRAMQAGCSGDKACARPVSDQSPRGAVYGQRAERVSERTGSPRPDTKMVMRVGFVGEDFCVRREQRQNIGAVESLLSSLVEQYALTSVTWPSSSCLGQ